MRILLAISFVALIALLWAMVAIMQHVRRARRRRRRFLESVPPPAGHGLGLANIIPVTKVPEMNFKDLAAPEPPPVPMDEPAIAPAHETYSTEAAAIEVAEPEISAQAEEQLEAVSDPPRISAPAKEPLTEPATAEAEPEITVDAEDFVEAEAAAEVVPEPHAEEPQQAEADASSEAPQIYATNYIPYAAPAPAAASAANDASIATVEEHGPAAPGHVPATPRVVRSHSAKHPLASLVPQLNRPDWAYFNKDMGDLSDPEPRSVRPKMRPTNSD
jgi:hypothetical protein